MANEGYRLIDDSFVSTNDLSTKQYFFVKLSAARTVVLCAAATDVPMGVLQNKPTAGQTAEVLVLGQTKLATAAATAVGSLLGTASTGLAAILVPGTDTTKYVVGTNIDATGAANGLCTAYINCINPHRAA